ncbi:hypothetical protein PaG_02090 [Moesziomyces aphidis]|uniref:Zn(2)-C6 fungal-type domain-containing protein n=1 Tax=Moesziomyces aphidis TaxID=84754 RepID=W3VSM9_MOEAP|nr:hypothetical protein PaG_02090 [Moesziomyces aphidis]
MQGSADIPGNVVVKQKSRPYRNNFRLHQPSASAVAVIGCVAFDCNPSRHSTPVFDTSRRPSQGSLHTALFSVALQPSIRIRPSLHRLPGAAHRFIRLLQPRILHCDSRTSSSSALILALARTDAAPLADPPGRSTLRLPPPLLNTCHHLRSTSHAYPGPSIALDYAMAASDSHANGESSRTTTDVTAAASVPSSKPSKRKAEKMQTSPSAADLADSNGVKPLARAVLVCKRCRSKKIKCDQAFPACGSCVKAGEPCVGIDSATGREVSRSYIVDLEHQITQLRAQNAELERLLAERPSSGPLEPGALGMKRPLQHVEDEFPLAASEKSTSPDARPLKRLAASPESDRKPDPARPFLPGLVLGPAGVEVVPSDADGHTTSGARPSMGRLNSHASGLSPARLLCQAIQQSAQAGLHVRDPGSAARIRRSGTQRLGDELNRRATTLSSQDPSKLLSESREAQDGGAKAEARLGSPQSGSATPSDTKKNSPFDDGDPMQYATATETADITVPAPEQALKPSPLPAPFPPLSIARKLIDAYFERVNPQLPILDRSSFMTRFEKACKLGLERARAKLSAHERGTQEDDDDKLAIELQPADGHLFHLVFAIAAAMGWTRSSWSAENHHEAAMRFLDPRRLATPNQEGNVGAIMGRDALEQLQCLLLTALYSIMRPMKPGVWYCLGVALRLTTGIGLYTETPGVLEASASASQVVGETLAERKRRLFWCSYALDRQVCVHLGRPFGIADSDIKVNLPWVDSAGDMIQVAIEHQGSDVRQAGSAENDGDSSIEMARREAASTLAALQSSTSEQHDSNRQVAPVSLPKPKDASRWVSLSFFRMRILQSEIQSILYQNAELPRRFSSYGHWKNDVLQRLHAWRRYAPSSKAELEANGCGYNPIFLELNYQQTLLMVYGLSPRFPNASRKDLASVEECSRSIINMYATLSKEGQMNYTWMTGHNVFIACTSYLYAIWQISATDPASFRSSVTLGFRNKVDEIHHFAAACDKVLSSLQWATAEKCRKCLRTMFYATSVVVEKIDRAAPAAADGGSRKKTSHDRPADRSTQRSKSGANVIKKPHFASPGRESSSLHASASPQRYPQGTSPGPWSLYAQDRDWRQPPSDGASESGPAQPHPEASAHPSRWNQRPGAVRSPQQQSTAPWPAAELGHDRLATSHDPYASSSGTTPSRGLDTGGGATDASSMSHAWYEAGPGTSPRVMFPDSPSNFDISSLMATSAMELDALFREAGLSAGPSGDQRGWETSTPAMQHSALGPAPPLHGAAGGREQSAPHYVQGEALSFYESVGGSVEGADASKWGFPAGSGPGINVEHRMAEDMGQGEAFESDWEALGFGYRIAAPTAYNAFAEPVSDAQQRGFTSMRGDVQSTGAATAASAGNPATGNLATTEFDHRFLDSHMGF